MADGNEFMGGGTGRTVPFENVGDTITGMIMALPEKRQQTDPNTGEAKTFPDGSPRWIFVLRIMTELREADDPADDGERVLYLKWKSLDAVRAAIRAAGKQNLEVGGFLTLTLSGFGAKTKNAWNPPKLWNALYQPPDPVSIMDEATSKVAVLEELGSERARQQAAIARLRQGQPAASQGPPPF